MPSSLSILLATACPPVPAYHPDTLMQYAVLGEMDRVRAILRHLHDAIAVVEAGQVSQADDAGDATTGHAPPPVDLTRPPMFVDTLPPVTLAGLIAQPGVGAGVAERAGVTTAGAASEPAAAAAATDDRYDALFSLGIDGDGDGAAFGAPTDAEALYHRLEGARQPRAQ